MLKDLQAMIQGHMCEEDVETLDIELPLQTMEQLDETETYLENDGAQKRMVKPNKNIIRKCNHLRGIHVFFMYF